MVDPLALLKGRVYFIKDASLQTNATSLHFTIYINQLPLPHWRILYLRLSPYNFRTFLTLANTLTALLKPIGEEFALINADALSQDNSRTFPRVPYSLTSFLKRSTGT